MLAECAVTQEAAAILSYVEGNVQRLHGEENYDLRMQIILGVLMGELCGRLKASSPSLNATTSTGISQRMGKEEFSQ